MKGLELLMKMVAIGETVLLQSYLSYALYQQLVKQKMIIWN